MKRFTFSVVAISGTRSKKTGRTWTVLSVRARTKRAAEVLCCAQAKLAGFSQFVVARVP